GAGNGDVTVLPPQLHVAPVERDRPVPEVPPLRFALRVEVFPPPLRDRQPLPRLTARFEAWVAVRQGADVAHRGLERGGGTAPAVYPVGIGLRGQTDRNLPIRSGAGASDLPLRQPASQDGREVHEGRIMEEYRHRCSPRGGPADVPL